MTRIGLVALVSYAALQTSAIGQTVKTSDQLYIYWNASHDQLVGHLEQTVAATSSGSVSFIPCSGKILTVSRNDVKSTPGTCADLPSYKGGVLAGTIGNVVFSAVQTSNGVTLVRIIDAGQSDLVGQDFHVATGALSKSLSTPDFRSPSGGVSNIWVTTHSEGFLQTMSNPSPNG